MVRACKARLRQFSAQAPPAATARENIARCNPLNSRGLNMCRSLGGSMTAFRRVTGLMLLFALSFASVTGLRAGMNGKNIGGRHRIEMGFGLLTNIKTDNTVLPGVTSTDVSIDGPAFSLGYGYWPAEEWSISLRMVVLGVDAGHHVTVGSVTTEASTVVPFLFAVGFQPRALAPSPGIRPFFTVGIGPFVGVRASNHTNVGTVTIENRTESAFGAHFGAGVDCLLSRLISLRFSGGYYLVSEFDEPVSGEKDYSTPEFTVALGFNFGRGK